MINEECRGYRNESIQIDCDFIFSLQSNYKRLQQITSVASSARKKQGDPESFPRIRPIEDD
jgi:hypothetical protein